MTLKGVTHLCNADSLVQDLEVVAKKMLPILSSSKDPQVKELHSTVSSMVAALGNIQENLGDCLRDTGNYKEAKRLQSRNRTDSKVRIVLQQANIPPAKRKLPEEIRVMEVVGKSPETTVPATKKTKQSKTAKMEGTKEKVAAFVLKCPPEQGQFYSLLELVTAIEINPRSLIYRLPVLPVLMALKNLNGKCYLACSKTTLSRWTMMYRKEERLPRKGDLGITEGRPRTVHAAAAATQGGGVPPTSKNGAAPVVDTKAAGLAAEEKRNPNHQLNNDQHEKESATASDNVAPDSEWQLGWEDS